MPVNLLGKFLNQNSAYCFLVKSIEIHRYETWVSDRYSRLKLEGGINLKDSASLSLKICLDVPEICDYQILSQIFDILFSFGINRGNVKSVPKIGNLEVQMGVTLNKTS